MRKKSTGTNESGITRYSAYHRGIPKDGSPHYVFLYSDDEFGDENIPLQPQKPKKSVPRKVEVINVTLKAEDTLQALALKYRCTISELKRINNIHKENEIYARRTIKVPVQPYSIFTEINEENGSTNNNSDSRTSKLIDLSDAKESQDSTASIAVSNIEQCNLLTLINVSLSSTSQSQSLDINNLILNSVCEPSASKDNTNIAENGEHDELLINKEYDKDSTPEAQVIQSFKCSGADWGLSWIHLLGVSILLGFVLPIIYIFYVAENNNKHHEVDFKGTRLPLNPLYDKNIESLKDNV
ncbi:lysM and putative peptidoglycan-binding domain-containing protein 4 [Chelonus insularis]|uniref:lysM and putative peptidoglycan-binding domain-containing protein 4 n=1 Tax=Chelonus insularis TaxID=460826 RepID=UPI00158943EC|nr:lysM and putative peptidoglycan-binding domain-containing protein 4 [Chelonus insularis]